MSQTGIPINSAEIAAFCDRWQVREFSLFGSVLRDDFRPESDVDVLISIHDDARYGLWETATVHVPV